MPQFIPTGGQLQFNAPRLPTKTMISAVKNIVCPTSTEERTNNVETARVATIPFTANITLRWINVNINGKAYKIDLGDQILTLATQVVDIASLRAKIVDGHYGLNNLIGEGSQLTIAVVSTNLVITITSEAAYLPVSVQSATAAVNFV